MRRISFDRRFVNEAGNDLIPGKIHTIRRNLDFWKRFEGRDVALFYWEGKPRRSRQKVFCVKRIVSVQEAEYTDGSPHYPYFSAGNFHACVDDGLCVFAKNDGFEALLTNEQKKDPSLIDEYLEGCFAWWFGKYPSGKMAILHFTDFRY